MRSSRITAKPNLFLVGAPKAGTSAVANFLMQSADIYARVKEPRYFDAHVFYDDASLYPIKTITDYLSLYSGRAAASSRYRLDASVFVMYSSASIRRIIDFNPDARFIVILRDPLSAAKSMFQQRLKSANKSLREVSEDFCECWNLIPERRVGRGFPTGCKNKMLFRYDLLYHYEKYVPNIIHEVDPKNLIIVRYEDFLEKQEEFCRMLFNFIEVRTPEGLNPSVPVNASITYSNSRWNRLLEWIVRSSSAIRRSVGLRGDNVRSIRDFVMRVKKRENFKTSNHCDESVIKEFEVTYAFLDSLDKNKVTSRV